MSQDIPKIEGTSYISFHLPEETEDVTLPTAPGYIESIAKKVDEVCSNIMRGTIRVTLVGVPLILLWNSWSPERKIEVLTKNVALFSAIAAGALTTLSGISHLIAGHFEKKRIYDFIEKYHPPQALGKEFVVVTLEPPQ